MRVLMRERTIALGDDDGDRHNAEDDGNDASDGTSTNTH